MASLPNILASLPLAAAHSRIEAQLAKGGNLLLTAPTGTGKSSLLPWLLAGKDKRVAMLQPRRIAALGLAQFLAQAYGETPGNSVGYRFHLESCFRSETRILFQTYGSFLQATLHDQDPPWDWVVFDEFHERRTDMDLLLAYLLRWQQQAPDQAPRIAVLSAEINRENMESLLGIPCLPIANPGYPVQVIYQENPAGDSLETQVVRAIRNLRANQIWETTLVFLPGKSEIEQCHRAVQEALGNDAAELLDLYGGQDSAVHRRILAGSSRPRVVFTTNIAETSLTIPQVCAVIDSGMERSGDYNVNQDLRILRLGRISLQNAIQRTGRAGRTRPGVCIRLWSEREEASFPQEIIPEVLRSKPDQLLLYKAALARRLEISGNALALPTAVPAALAAQSLQELARLELIDSAECITEKGRAALDVPVMSVQLAALLAEQPAPADLLLACAVILDSGNDVSAAARESRNLLELAHSLQNHERGVPREWPRLLEQLRTWRQRKKRAPSATESPITIALNALLNAFPQSLAIQDGAGKAYKLNEQLSLVIDSKLTGNAAAILAFALLRTGNQKNQQVRAALFIPVPADMLGLEKAEVRYELVWRAGQERYTGLRIRTQRGREMERRELIPQECSAAELTELTQLTAAVWQERMRREDLSHLWRTESTDSLLARMQQAHRLFPEYSFPPWDASDWEVVMNEFVDGIFLQRDLNVSRFRKIVEDYFGVSMLGWLARTFPDQCKLPGGRTARYTYHADGMVELSARIADFLGMQGEHSIAENRLKVRYDILAPNYRTVQKTWDLSGFWKNTYPEIRKELRGRYPRHPWPENPVQG